MMKIASVAEANAAGRDLERVVRAWCDWRTAVAIGKPPADPRLVE